MWERPWSLEEIRKGSQSWSLASDAGVSGAAGVGPEPGAGGVRGPPLGPGGAVCGAVLPPAGQSGGRGSGCRLGEGAGVAALGAPPGGTRGGQLRSGPGGRQSRRLV